GGTMTRSCWAVLFWLGLSGPVLGGGRDGEEGLRAVLDAYEARQKQMNSFWGRFDLEHLETAAWQQGIGRKNARDGASKILGEYARVGEKTRTWAHRQDPRIPPARQVSFVLYDGKFEVRTSNRENEYMVPRKPSAVREAVPPTDLSGEEHLLATLRGWVK